MALRISAGDDVKRGDVFFIDPAQVIVKNELRGRSRPPAPDAIIRRAINMLEVGQLQPVEARRVEQNHLMLNLGFTRTAAARLIREGFDHEGVHYGDPQFMLQVRVVDCNDEQAFIRNVVENAQRDQTSPIDDAMNQQRLREYGKNDVEIAKLYGYGSNGKPSSSKVSRLRKLLQLSKEQQEMVHEGTLSVQAALDLLELPTEKRDEAIKAAKEASVTEGHGKEISGSQVRAVVRDHILHDDNKAPTPATPGDTAEDPKGAKPRTMREIRKFLETTMRGEDADPAVARFCQDTLRWLNGKTTDKAMSNAIGRLLDAKPSRK